MQINNPNVHSALKQMEYEKGKWSHVLIVKTDLSLDPENSTYNEGLINTLLQDITSAVKARNSGFHKIKLEESGN